MADKSCLVAVCCNQPTIYTQTTQSLQELGWGDRIPYTRNKFGFERIELQWFTGSPRVDMLRNQAVQAAIGRNYTHLIFLDADMVWPTTVIHDLLAHHDRGIVGGLYVLKGPPYSPVHLVDRFEKDGLNQFYRATDYETDLVPVDVLGMGCTLIPVEAFRAVGDSGWFAYDNDNDGMPRVSEDVTFCLKAQAAGYQSYMDPRIKCGHVGAMVFTDRHHIRYQQSVEASKEMGPIVSLKQRDDATDGQGGESQPEGAQQAKGWDDTEAGGVHVLRGQARTQKAASAPPVSDQSPQSDPVGV